MAGAPPNLPPVKQFAPPSTWLLPMLMRRMMMPGAAATLFLPAGKINRGMPFFSASRPRSGRYSLRLSPQKSITRAKSANSGRAHRTLCYRWGGTLGGTHRIDIGAKEPDTVLSQVVVSETFGEPASPAS